MLKVKIFYKVDDFTREVWRNNPDYAEQYQEKPERKSAQPTRTLEMSVFAFDHAPHLISFEIMVLHLNDLLIILECEFGRFESEK